MTVDHQMKINIVALKQQLLRFTSEMYTALDIVGETYPAGAQEAHRQVAKKYGLKLPEEKPE